ncbi:F0F1 ATP synthase subunit epsilon [Methylocaldum sp.]|uniref:F0F1 ATP synthase subunit epsilon n=1 Tax=Methylocaldum sp. TaxID=1969727 RepID=UPI002D6A5C60|nr:F0F1 ATP synthase subunit epsilon [Methylocaldum sp.]HYE34420.1 F0F1 ATP synthase subunit epsilon [Methylocaldum sp.]
MSTFVLNLQSSRLFERIENVESFVGEDASGSFGLRAHHERFMTAMVFGLARYRCPGEPWQYLALPGALAYFLNNELFINTRRYIRDSDYNRISEALTEQLLKEEETLTGLKQNLRRLEEAMLTRLLEIERGR